MGQIVVICLNDHYWTVAGGTAPPPTLRRLGTRGGSAADCPVSVVTLSKNEIDREIVDRQIDM